MKLSALRLGRLVDLKDAPTLVAVFETEEGDDPNVRKSAKVAELIPVFGTEPSRVRLVRDDNVRFF